MKKQTPIGKTSPLQYREGDYYAGQGWYIGTRKTYTINGTIKTEHLFRKGKDISGTAILKRIPISEEPQ